MNDEIRPAPARDVSLDQLKAWLAAYGVAWEQKDSEALLKIFAADGTYHDNVFGPVMAGQDAIRKYWDDTTAGQKDITFSSEAWTAYGNVGIAHWRAELTAVSSGEKLVLDGVFHLTFSSNDGPVPICGQLKEWWFFKTEA